MKFSENVDKLGPALLKAQKSIKHSELDSTNPHFKSKYSSLKAIIDAVKKDLNDNELIILQSATNGDGKIHVTTRIMHTSGQFVEDTLSLSPQTQTPQAYGSAITYGKRYTLASLAGISAEEDDDGNQASKTDSASLKASTKQQQTQNTITVESKATDFQKKKLWELINATNEENDYLQKLIEEHVGVDSLSNMTISQANKAVEFMTARGQVS